MATGTRAARSEITGFMLRATCRVLAEEVTRVSGALPCQRRRSVPGARSWADGNVYGEADPVASVVIFGLSEDAGHWSEALRVRQTRWRSVFDAVLAIGTRAPKKAVSTMCDTSISVTKDQGPAGCSDAEVFRVAIDQPIPGVRVVRITGELDLQTAPQLHSCLLSQIDGRGRDVVVDLSKVTFLGAAGLESLVRAREAATCRHIKLHLAGVDHRAVALPLEITGLLPTFAIHP